MTFTVKIRTSAGAPIVAEYECPTHGRFTATVERDVNGDPPAEVPCSAPAELNCPLEDDRPFDVANEMQCGRGAPWRISAPQLKRDSVPCYAAVKGGDVERRPGMLDTRPLAEGMPAKEWKAKQRAATQERRHHELIAKGLKTKRVQA